MIATDTLLSSFVRLIAPLVWARDERIAEKLLDFAATEAGSSLDMLAAAELTSDKRLRRLFFRHALDEARHARMFQEAARSLVPSPRSRRWSLIHATRQNLYRSMGEIRFLAFVHLAERRGEAHFRALARHFRERDDLRTLLERIAKDERFHVSYSRRALVRADRRRVQATARSERSERRRKARALPEPGPAVRSALAGTRLRSAWQAWRRQGRIIGDLVARSMLAAIFLLVVPFFAWLLRRLEPEETGWKPAHAPRDLDEARNQF